VRSVVLLALAACGGPHASTTTGGAPLANRGTSASLPPLYAQLFVEGEKTFPAEKIVSHQGENGPETDRESGTITCTVSGVRAITGGMVAEVACTGSLDLPSSPSGTYVGTATGLWRVEGTDTPDVSQLGPEQMLFAAKPAKQRRETKDPGDDVDSGSAIIVEPHGSGWCVLVTSWGGDEGGWQLCLREGAGVIGGHGFFAGGETHDVYFGDVRRL
jgi:hypothetical protein